MKKYLILIIVVFFVSGCMASFPAKYDPKYSMNPQLGKEQRVYANAKFENAFGKEMRDESLKLQTLIDKKIEDWGFNKDRTGKNLDITVKNVLEGGNTAGAVITGFICGLTLYVIPSIAVDKYRMTVVINEEGKEPITRVYNGSITTYQQIFLTIWGLFVYPIKNAMYTTIDNMLDHFINDLAEDSKKAIPITPSVGTTKTLTWTSANVWSGPGNDYSVVTTVKQGDKLTVIGESGEWFNVRLENGQQGWISNRVVK